MIGRKHILLFLSSLLVFICFIPTTGLASSGDHWGHYQKGVKYFEEKKYELAIIELERATKDHENGSYLRKLAEAYEAAGQFQNAANTYYREAEVHRRIGEKSNDMNTYFAVLAKADALNTTIEFYVEENVQTVSSTKLGKFEPASGMYIGGYIEKDRGLESLGAGKYAKFNELAGKDQSLYFTYHRYGNPFPHVWARSVKQSGAAIQLALQPDGGLDAVKDDAYLRQFARDAQAADVPILLRFASEMNGTWVKWNGNPAKYKQKFQLVAKVMAEEAPNVAMVWSPAANPKRTIHEYYPGDEWVDWVGVSIYSVKFFNGNVKQPADHVNPLDSLDFIYKEYADRKPIMVSEYGATHYSKAGNQDATLFSQTKMSMLYHGAKLKYPRLKAVQWFSLNTLTDSHSEERSLNNFALTENKSVLSHYAKTIADPYYLTTVQKNNDAVPAYRRTISKLNETVIRSQAKGYVWIKTYDPYISKVVISVNGKQTAELKQYPFAFQIDPAQLGTGRHRAEVVVYDSKNRVAAKKTMVFAVGAPVGELGSNELKMFIGDKGAYSAEGRSVLPAAPFTEQGRTLVPLRFVTENMGALVKWDSKARQAVITSDKTIVLTEGSTSVLVDGEQIEIEAAPQVKNGVTFVPLRFINDHLGGKTSYKASEQSVLVVKK